MMERMCLSMRLCTCPMRCEPECTKIAHRHSLAIFTADEGIAGNSAARAIFTHFLRRRNRGSLAIFFAEEIAHLGASKKRATFLRAGPTITSPKRSKDKKVYKPRFALEF